MGNWLLFSPAQETNSKSCLSYNIALFSILKEAFHWDPVGVQSYRDRPRLWESRFAFVSHTVIVPICLVNRYGKSVGPPNDRLSVTTQVRSHEFYHQTSMNELEKSHKPRQYCNIKGASHTSAKASHRTAIVQKTSGKVGGWGNLWYCTRKVGL